MKRISIVSLLLVLSLVFVGCTADEAKLLNAFEKTQNIISMESDSEMTLTVEVEKLPNQPASIQEVASMLNGAKINMNQRMASNSDKTRFRTEGTMGVNVGGISMDMQVWINAIMDQKNPDVVEIIKMPQLLMGAMGPEAIGKEYIVYDLGELMAEEEGMDLQKLMLESNNLNKQLVEIVKNQAANLDPGFKVITVKGQEEINGEKLSLYEIKLNDEMLKELIKLSGNDLLGNKSVAKLVGSNASLAQAGQLFDLVMDGFEDITVLGDKGMTLVYGVNDKGYITYEAGTIDLNIDAAKIEKAFNKNGEAQMADIPAVRLGMTFETNVNNINQDVQIKMPTVNNDNALYFNDLVQELE